MAQLRSLIALALLGAPTSGRGIQGADCNENGSSDGHDIVSGLSLDCNQNLVPDECDILPRGAAFEEISSVGVGQRPRAAGAADLDGDGDVDLVTANQDSNDRTMLFREEATFVRGPTVPLGRQPLAVATGDLDGDGKTDAVVSNFSDRSLSLIERDGSGGFTTTTIASGVGLVRVVASDFDSDADLDLAGTDFDSHASILFNDGSGAFPRLEAEFVGETGGSRRGRPAGPRLHERRRATSIGTVSSTSPSRAGTRGRERVEERG